MGIRHELVGQQFGRLRVLSKVRKGAKPAWECACDCGGKNIVLTDRLKSGHTTSCGCRKKERALENCAKNAIQPRHGMTDSPTHNSWASMVQRCRGQGSGGYYKRMGITVCERWSQFENFLEDMGERPNKMTLDRVDGKLGYYRENCRWATAKTQQNNRGNTRYLLVNGAKVSLMCFANSEGLNKNAAQYFFTVLKANTAKGLIVEVFNGGT